MRILNLTQHAATVAQKEEGVFDPYPRFQEEIVSLLTFEEIPSKEEMEARASRLAEIANCHFEARGHDQGVMIGGAGFFMSTLEEQFYYSWLSVHHAFSQRVSAEKDGVKTSVFEHLGFYKV